MVERLSLVEHKPDADGQAVEMPPHIFVKSFEILKTCAVFICSDDHTRFGQRQENLVDTLRVLCLEEMMVGKSQGSNRPTLFFQVGLHLQGRGDACEQQYILATQRRARIGERLCLFGEDRNRCIVVDAGEVKLLIRIEVHSLGEHAKLHRLQVFRTLRDDHDVCPALAVETLTQPASRQEFVVDDQTVIVDEQDIDAWFDIAVLVGIVEKDDIDIVRRLVMCHPVYALTPVLVYSNVDIGEFLFHLIRLVTDLACCCLVIGEDITLALTLIATREHAHPHHISQQSDKIFHMRCLARSAHRDVANGNDRYGKGPLFKHSKVKKPVAKAYAQAIKPAQWQEPFIDFDVIPFCSHDYYLIINS